MSVALPAKRACCGVLLACGLALPTPPAAAQDTLQPSIRQPLRDAEFGVRTRQFGLQRQVRMYQWRREGEGFVGDWIGRAVDSSGFPGQYANPGPMPFSTRYWLPSDLRIDGKPVDDEVLQALGEWRTLRPGFSALPGNMSATFQPEGDGLGTAENPQAPRIGDLRIGWRELVLPPLAGKVEVRDGRWRLREAASLAEQAPEMPARDAAEPLPPSAAPMPAVAQDNAARASRRGLFPAVLVVMALWVVAVLWRRRRRM